MVTLALFSFHWGSDPWVDESLESLEERAEERKKGSEVGLTTEDEVTSLEILSLESVTYADYDNPSAFIEERCGTTPIIHQLSPLAWVGLSGEIYILECFGTGFIYVGPLKDQRGDFPAAPRDTNNLTWKRRSENQVPSILHPSYGGKGHSQDVKSFTIPATPPNHASAKS